MNNTLYALNLTTSEIKTLKRYAVYFHRSAYGNMNATKPIAQIVRATDKEEAENKVLEMLDKWSQEKLALNADIEEARVDSNPEVRAWAFDKKLYDPMFRLTITKEIR